MFGSLTISAIGAVAAAKAEHEAFERRMALLSPEEAQALREARA